MANVNAKIDLSINSVLESAADLGNLTYESRVSKVIKFTPGVSTIAQADLMWADSRSLAASTSEDIDLSGGVSDVFGVALSFAEVTSIFVENTGTSTITVGGAASNGFIGPFGAAAHTITIPAGDIVLLTNMNGWAVTAGTGDILKVLSGAGSTGTYNIVVIGRTVAV